MNNKEIVKGFIEEILEPLNYEHFSDYVADEAVWHGTTGEIQGADTFQRLTSKEALKPFSQSTMTIKDIVAEGDKVVVRFSHTATHSGQFLGLAPTHKTYTWDGTVIYQLRSGKIVESWTYEDLFSLAMQMGLIQP